MKLGQIIKNYRKDHEMSMDKFSEISGISKSYISLLEKDRHPKTGNPITPSISFIKQAADAMNMDFNVLFSMIEGDVALNDAVINEPLSAHELDIISAYRNASPDLQVAVCAVLGVKRDLKSETDSLQEA